MIHSCLYSCFQDREDDIASRQHSLDTINANGRHIAHNDTMSQEDRDNIQRDLANLNQRWTKVSSSFSAFHGVYRKRLGWM
jgi:hypothetical protein